MGNRINPWNYRLIYSVMARPVIMAYRAMSVFLSALMVFSTALGTALFGFLIDRGFSIEQIAMVSFIYIFISLILLFFVRNKLNPQYI